MIKVEINKQTTGRVPLSLMKKTNRLVESKLKTKKNYQVSLAIITPKKIREFNRVYRGKDYVTDVLSFEGDKKNAELGEILICYKKAEAQAKEKKHSVAKEFVILYLHGMLHLFGLDHERLKDALIMEKIEKEILAAIKF
jgi:probable rRNA maturation factor